MVSIHRSKPPVEAERVAIIGGGASGLAALWSLENSPHDVDLFEASDRLGGHANTATFTYKDRQIPVDTGFITFNQTNYRWYLVTNRLSIR